MLKIVSVTASGDDGNVPTNVLDNNANTRWSAEGIGSWIQADLGAVNTINEVDISWYKGDTGRISSFQITTSLDNLSFQPAFTGKSSGTTAALEKYPIVTEPTARYVRITVNGNNQNNWASITELQILGGGSPPPPGPIPIPPPGTRQQVRQTTTGGDPVPDADWTIVADTGALPVIQPPGIMTVQNETLSVLENTALQIVLSATDTNANAKISFENTQPANGKVTAGNQPVAVNQISLVYTPNEGFSGTDSFLYSATDDKGASSNSGTVTINVSGTSPPPQAVDAFGHKLIYAVTADGSSWSMNMNNPGSDSRSNNPESSSYMPKFTKNSDGSWKIQNQIEIRWAISQNNGYIQSKLCTDFTKCKEQGYMQDNMDWGSNSGKAHMMRAYYRINAASTSSSNGEGHIEHVMRGGRSTTSNSTFGGPCNCAIGCSDNYHCNCYCNALHGLSGTARQKFEKDLFHTSGYSKDVSGVNNNSAYNFTKGQWFGLTTIVYNRADGSVQLETWTDADNTDTWKKTHSWVDTGANWPPRGTIGNCNLPPSPSGSPAITFGGPLSVFRSDNLTDYDIRDAVILSIDPSRPLMAAEEHARTFPENDLVIKEDEVYQQEKWHDNDKVKEDKPKVEQEKPKITKEEGTTVIKTNFDTLDIKDSSQGQQKTKAKIISDDTNTKKDDKSDSKQTSNKKLSKSKDATR